MDKNSLLWIIQYCPFLVSCASYLTYLYLYTFKAIICRKKNAMLMSQAMMYSNFFKLEIL